MNIKVIIGSTRPNRISEKPAHWIADELKKEGLNAEVLDLRDYPMPFLDTPLPPAALGGKYPHETVNKWAAKIKEADGFVIVSPEYNHGYPAVLKNALDWLYPEWEGKPVGFISYGSALGARSVEQLRLVSVELRMIPLYNALHLSGDMYMAMAKSTMPVDPEIFAPLRKTWQGDKVKMFIDELKASL